MNGIIDMHCDTLIEGWRHPERSIVDGEFSINLNLLKSNNSLLQFFAIYLSRIEMKTIPPLELFYQIYEYYDKMVEENTHLIGRVLSYKDVEENCRNNKLSALLTIEDGVFLENRIDRLKEVYDKGVRLLTILWNFENSVGFPCSDDRELHLKGLKEFGFQVVDEMNRLGMIIDVSHLSEGGFYDVAKHSKYPFVASHSCARGLCNHRRNLTDEQLKTLGEKGGMVGINFERSFLKENSKKATIAQVIEHLLYIKNKAGIDSVGFGSDFDGIVDNGEFVNYSGYGTLIETMSKYFTDDEIDRICRLNSLRILKEVIG